MQFIGILYLVLTFVFCFAVVHIAKLAYYGFLSLRKKPQPKEPVEPPKQEKEPPKPVYYIVEKKRTKKSYSKPKEIEFK
jgi:flagellar basal body-associated protein FliL